MVSTLSWDKNPSTASVTASAVKGSAWKKEEDDDIDEPNESGPKQGTEQHTDIVEDDNESDWNPNQGVQEDKEEDDDMDKSSESGPKQGMEQHKDNSQVDFE